MIYDMIVKYGKPALEAWYKPSWRDYALAIYLGLQIQYMFGMTN